MRAKTYCFLALFLYTAVAGQEIGGNLILVPLNPLHIRDDAFDVEIGTRGGGKMTLEKWVLLESDFKKYSFVEQESPFLIGSSRKVAHRLFLVRKGTPFKAVKSEIDKLKSLGFRDASLRNLVAIVNGPNARLMGPKTGLMASATPMVRDGEGIPVSVDNCLYGASIGGGMVELGFIGEKTFPTFDALIVVFEAPREKEVAAH